MEFAFSFITSDGTIVWAWHKTVDKAGYARNVLMNMGIRVSLTNKMRENN